MIFSILPKFKKLTKLSILRKKEAQDSEFRSFFERIEDTINCFRDLLTFSSMAAQSAVECVVFGSGICVIFSFI